MLNPGDVVLAKVQYIDTFEVKVRPAVVLFEDCGNVIVAGITSNKEMKGIPLTIKEGAIKDSVIKLNYIFTVSEAMINKILFHLDAKKKKLLFAQLTAYLQKLND